MGWRGPLTARQADVWEAWLRIEWNRPHRSDLYIMHFLATYLNTKRSEKTDPIITWQQCYVEFFKTEKKPVEVDPNDPIKYVTKEMIHQQQRLATGEATQKTRKRSETPYRPGAKRPDQLPK